MNLYVPGQTVVLWSNFVDPTSRNPVTPSAVKLRILDPTSTETDVTSGFGNAPYQQYNWPVIVDIPGSWSYRWEASGTYVAACEGQFAVSASPFAPPY